MISVIMSTYREKPDYIHQAIRSILKQTHRDLELILVPDDPENMPVISLLQEYEARDQRVTVLENEKNLGLPGALNKALKVARGDYIARMDADDISHPERFEVQLQYMREHNLDLVGTRKRCIDEQGELLPGRESTYYSPKMVMKQLRWADCLPHSTWLAKREVYDLLEGYRDMPRSEDYDFLLRALKMGMKMGMCDRIVFDYRINDTGISRSGMLEQLLATWYLVDNFDRIGQLAPQEVRDYVSAKLTWEGQERYTQATKYFERAVCVRKKHPLKCGIYLIKSMMVSPYYRRRMITILKLKLMNRSEKG